MNNLISLKLVGLLVSLVICAIFAFLETCITALRPFKIRELEDNFLRYRGLLKVLEQQPQQIIILTLIVSSLVNAISAALITDFMEMLFHGLKWSAKLGFSAGIFVATSAILIFGEIIPKHLAKSQGERYISSALWILDYSFYLMSPFIHMLDRLSKQIVPKHKTNPQAAHVTSEKELQFLIKHHEEHGLIEHDKTAMLQNVFRLGRIQVREIMVPDTEIIALDAAADIGQALELFSQSHFSRLPVYHQHPTNIIGILYQKDLFPLLNTEQAKLTSIKRLIRPVLFVPESQKVEQLLREFKKQQSHMAIVLNEYGSMIGLVTLEDALEELVGEITDEHELIQQKIVPLPTGGWLVDGNVSIDTLSDMLKVDFASAGSATLGGFLTERMQHLPQKDDQFDYQHYQFKITEADLRKVLKVQINHKQPLHLVPAGLNTLPQDSVTH